MNIILRICCKHHTAGLPKFRRKPEKTSGLWRARCQLLWASKHSGGSASTPCGQNPMVCHCVPDNFMAIKSDIHGMDIPTI